MDSDVCLDCERLWRGVGVTRSWSLHTPRFSWLAKGVYRCTLQIVTNSLFLFHVIIAGEMFCFLIFTLKDNCFWGSLSLSNYSGHYKIVFPTHDKTSYGHQMHFSFFFNSEWRTKKKKKNLTSEPSLREHVKFWSWIRIIFSSSFPQDWLCSAASPSHFEATKWYRERETHITLVHGYPWTQSMGGSRVVDVCLILNLWHCVVNGNLLWGPMGDRRTRGWLVHVGSAQVCQAQSLATSA